LPPAEYEELNIKTTTAQCWLPAKRASTKPRALQRQLGQSHQAGARAAA
jgi:hypothetical protein